MKFVVTNETVDDVLQERNQHTDMLKQLGKTQTMMKHATGRHRVDRAYIVGDSVYLKLRPYALCGEIAIPETTVQILWTL